MLLNRTMTLECDLPDAPDGCEWALISADAGQVALAVRGERLGFLSAIGMGLSKGVGAILYPQILNPAHEYNTNHPTEREAALALFAALGIG